MEDLREAERQQEQRVNALIRAAPEVSAKMRRVQFVDKFDTIEEEPDQRDDEMGVDSIPGARKAKSPLPRLSCDYFEDLEESSDESEDIDEYADDDDLVLHRWPSNVPASAIIGGHGLVKAADVPSTLPSLMESMNLDCVEKVGSLLQSTVDHALSVAPVAALH